MDCPIRAESGKGRSAHIFNLNERAVAGKATDDAPRGLDDEAVQDAGMRKSREEDGGEDVARISVCDGYCVDR